jgi:hypothetical protein
LDRWSAEMTDVHGAASIVIRPGGPESAIQATALMAARQWIEVPGEEGTPIETTLVVRLELPDGDRPVPLLIVPSIEAGTVEQLARWLRSSRIETGPVLDMDRKRQLGRWIGLPHEWLQAELLEGYA